MTNQESRWATRYGRSLMGVFGPPRLCLVEGQGSRVRDAEGRWYLDLLGGIAATSLGHAHPVWVEAVSQQAGRLGHVSNFFTTEPQLDLAEALLRIAQAPEGSAVFLANSGTEANEAAVKAVLAQHPAGRLVALEHAFHGRTLGALALTHKEAYRAPFAPLGPTVTFVAAGDEAALAAELERGDVAAVVVEPIQGEAGVVPLEADYLRAVRRLTRDHDAMLVVDEVQTGMGRTGAWFAHQKAGIVPDYMTLAKGLGGGFPIGALVTFGSHAATALAPGQHGTTFGGNPLAAAAALAVISTIESEGLLAQVEQVGERLRRGLVGSDRLVAEVRGEGLLVGIGLREPVAPALVEAAYRAGFIVNAPNPTTIRLAPPLVLTAQEADEFLAAWPALCREAVEATGGTRVEQKTTATEG